MRPHRPGTPQVPYAIGGKTHMVTPPRPRLPHNPDRILLRAITAAASLMLAACIVWATVNGGELLGRMVPEWAAYTAAAVFDGAWIICLGLEWVARHHPQQARAPRITGWVFLALSMAAVVVNGHDHDSWAVGIVGAGVSAIVKVVWTLLLLHHATPLDPMTQQWVDHERAHLAAQRGLLQVQVDNLHARAYLAGQHAALGLAHDEPRRQVPQLDTVPATERATPPVAPAATPVPAGQTAVTAPAATLVDDPVQLSRIIDAALADDGMSRAAMVRAVIKAAPHLSSREVAEAIETRRDVEIKPSYVRTIRTGRTKPPAQPPSGQRATDRGHSAGPYL
ncbi:hypothetical protein ACIGZH_01770 [Streptomyces sp. NPDC058319]|uniref:hypothetical protein n=1 Tax=unclassified Streptomyces TaxID=2593676 RepID=UPI0036E47088